MWTSLHTKAQIKRGMGGHAKACVILGHSAAASRPTVLLHDHGTIIILPKNALISATTDDTPLQQSGRILSSGEVATAVHCIHTLSPYRYRTPHTLQYVANHLLHVIEVIYNASISYGIALLPLGFGLPFETADGACGI